MAHISVDFGCSKSSVYRSIIWVEGTLSDDGRFSSLPGKKALREDVEVTTVAIDVTEHPVQHPKDEKEQKKHYSGKKKTYLILVDSGYQGIQHYHANSKTPTKKRKKKPLSEAEKESNTDLARQRVFIENINAKIKVFKIMASIQKPTKKTYMRYTKRGTRILGCGTSLMCSSSYSSV